MELALTLVAIAATVIVVARVSERIHVPAPLILLALGALVSFVPDLPRLELSPEVVLVGLLPPLLYSAALSTSLIAIRANLRPILSLSVGLVLFTAAGVGLLVAWLLPVGFAVAFAVGAVVAPPDAVAATAVARRIGLPRRTTTILEGESLLNDATALVALRTAVAAAGLSGAAVRAEVSPSGIAGSFLWALVGGVGIGWLVYAAVGAVRRRLTEAAADTALSFVVPFLAFIPAERVHASGILAVVTAGLLLAHQAPALQSAPSRLSEGANWQALTFLLENAVFLLIGLQVSWVFEDLRTGPLSVTRSLIVALAVLVAVLVLRPVWVVPFAVAGTSAQDRGPALRAALVGSWAGMRGVVTLAAALTLPAATPLRPVLEVIALTVVVGTLLLQGSTLPWVARSLGVRGPDAREDALQEAITTHAATGAGLRSIAANTGEDPEVVATIRHEAAARVNRMWERLSAGMDDAEPETGSEAYRRLRLQMIDAERAEVLRIRDGGEVDHVVLAHLLRALDAEESALTWSSERHAEVAESPPTSPTGVVGDCEHLVDEPSCAVPATPEGCAECLEQGLDWVHLRLCTHCGHVGCCDNSPGRHASAHFHETGHPVILSLEPGEAWRWCYIDRLTG